MKVIHTDGKKKPIEHENIESVFRNRDDVLTAKNHDAVEIKFTSGTVKVIGDHEWQNTTFKL